MTQRRSRDAGSNAALAATLRLDTAFACLSEADLALITDGARHTVLRTRELIYRQGDAARGFYIVESGVVRLVKGVATDGTGGIELRRLGPGAVFGVLDVLEDSSREVSAIALGRVAMFAISRADFDRVLSSSPEISIAIAQSLVDEPRDGPARGQGPSGSVH